MRKLLCEILGRWFGFRREREAVPGWSVSFREEGSWGKPRNVTTEELNELVGNVIEESSKDDWIDMPKDLEGYGESYEELVRELPKA